MAEDRKPPRLPMKIALLLAFALVAALPVWLAWQWPQRETLRGELAAVESQHQVYAASLSKALERYHRDVVAMFLLYHRNLRDMQDMRGGSNFDLFTKLGFGHVCRFRIADGALVGAADLPGRPCPEVAPKEKMELFLDLASEGEVRMSHVMPGPKFDPRPMLFLMRRSGDTVTVGALLTTYFQELGGTVEFGVGGHAAIVDHTGRFLWHPNADWMDPPKQVKGKIDIVDRMLAGESGSMTFYSPAREEEMLAGFAAVKGAGWGVMVPQPLKEIEAKIGSATRATILVFLFGLGIAMLLALVFTHVLVGPLRRIRVAAERLGNGAGDALIEPSETGGVIAEIDDLRAAFNAMVLRVRNSQRIEIEARKEAQEANRIKSRFLANMSHELRTPLNAIIGFAQVTKNRLKNTEAHERDTEYLGYIEEAGDHLLLLINDLLDLSRIEAGGHELQEVECDLSAAIEDVISLLRPIAAEKNIELISLGDAPLTLFADQRALKQVLLNLGSNAVRYTQPGGRVEIVAKKDTGTGISVLVRDNGPGIAEEELKQVRKPFASSLSHSREGSSGLGLSIVDGLLALHSARLELTSVEGEGTEAQIVFPIERTRRSSDPAQRANRPALRAEIA